MQQQELSLIIPTYNEKEIISKALQEIFTNLKHHNIDAEVLIVDDSRDGTEKILAEISKKYKKLKVIHREGKSGVGSAIRAGIENVSGKDAIVFMSDSPDDIKYLPSIVEKLRKGYALVHTSRFMKESKITGYPFVKTVANRLANFFVRVAFLRFDLKDFTSLFKGFDRQAIIKLNLEANEFDVGVEIAMKSIKKGLRVTEVPVSWMERKAGKSKLLLKKQAGHFIKRVLKVLFLYW